MWGGEMAQREAGSDPATEPSVGDPPLVGPVPAPGLHVMTWNIRRPVPAALTRPADRWHHRAPRVRALLTSERPTVLCAQEVAARQFATVLEALGPGYDHVGRGRSADGGGEACPIFFDATRLELLGWEQSALSDTPHPAGSVSWGNLFPRVMVEVHLRDRVTGHDLLVVNTHLDPLSGRSRLRSARALLEVVAARGLPAVVTGDLNAGSSSPAVRALSSEGTLVDSWRVARARHSEQWGTYADYRRPRRDGARIDWILTTPDLAVTDVAINPLRHEGGWPSDHLPVHAVVHPTGPDDEAHNGLRDGTRKEGGARRT